MMFPSADDERAIALNAKLKRPLLATSWRANRPLPQIVFFFLTCIGVATLAAFFEVIDLTALIAGVFAIGLAEVLIVKHRWWRTGVEGALWIGGAWATVVTLDLRSPGLWLTAFAIATALAWVRVRYALFAAVALGLGLFALKDLDAGLATLWVIVSVLVGVSVVSLAGLARTWRRPSTEWLFIALLVTAPIAGWMLLLAPWSEVPASYRTMLAFALYLPFAVVCAIAGLRLRHHAPLIASLVGTVIVALEAHEHLAFVAEAQLALAGAVLLGSSWLIARALRGRTQGLVVHEESLTDADQVVEMGAVLVTADRTDSQPPAEPQRVQGEGSFGGAGATGDY